ncbi:MAG: lcfB 1 [Firmicutes bacterium]|nr:lcfB 1 [Bacillota bacterium]
MLVHQLISQGQPSTIAFHSPKEISYAQLQKECFEYRNFFYHQGIRAGENVGLFSRNSAEFVYSYMALSSLGAIVVPLNFQLTAREIAYIVKDAQMKCLVTMEALDIAAELNQQGYSVDVTQLILPEFSGIFAANRFDQAPSFEDAIEETSPCVIIYTSGTTGNPKGAILTHKSLISNAYAFGSVLPPGSSLDNILCVLPMYHSFAWTCSVLYPLTLGASITILDGFTPKETLAAIKEKSVTIVFGVPPIYNYLTRIGTPEDMESVRTFVSGGAVDKAKFRSIGKPLPGVTVRIVNTKGETMPVDAVGELVVQGPNVMQGYYNLPVETSRALRNNWLHTGDIAYQDADGYLFIVDRLKDMIIINGENVYPREIEEILYAFPGVVEAAVIGVPDTLRGEAVRAYIVMEEGCSMDRKAIRNYLQPLLAAYKVPRDILLMDTLPKNKTGKIMKRLLREQLEIDNAR